MSYYFIRFNYTVTVVVCGLLGLCLLVVPLGLHAQVNPDTSETGFEPALEEAPDSIPYHLQTEILIYVDNLENRLLATNNRLRLLAEKLVAAITAANFEETKENALLDTLSEAQNAVFAAETEINRLTGIATTMLAADDPATEFDRLSASVRTITAQLQTAKTALGATISDYSSVTSQ